MALARLQDGSIGRDLSLAEAPAVDGSRADPRPAPRSPAGRPLHRAAPRVLGQMLLAAGAIDEAQLAAALEEQRRTRERLGEILIRGGVDAELVARSLADQLRMPYAAAPLRPDPGARDVIDRRLAARLRVVPLAVGGGVLRVATSEPLDAGALDDLRFQTGRRIEPVVASAATIDAALAASRDSDAVDRILTGERERHRAGRRGDESEEVRALRRASEAAPVVSVVDHVLERAAAQRASDSHNEPVEGGLRVRIRVDGVLRELLALPRRVAGAVVSRIKVMADLDIAVRRRPQDGRASITAAGRELALRVSTLPAHGGEKVVIRLLDPNAGAAELDSIGMTPELLASLRRLIGRSHGVLLVTGPTGSGKTTTLYAALAGLDRDRLNIVTLEDPVEYRLAGITQVQVHRRAGLSFAAALRAVLRQDPDVIMVGELRDRETVETAMAAALTGHLVLATLHTNDAPSAATRLAEMGVPAYLVAGGLIGVLAQRLARRVCGCAVAARCARCAGSGYHGRTGVFELLVVTPAIRTMLARRASAESIRAAARAVGMTSLGEDARRLVRAGLTTEPEVRPLLDLIDDEVAGCPGCGEPTRGRFEWCPACGVRLRHRCGCGVPLEQAWRVCPRCGRPAQSTSAGITPADAGCGSGDAGRAAVA